jgi:hypothetical protein
MPDAVLGRDVRCPLCAAAFVAQADSGGTGRPVVHRSDREPAPQRDTSRPRLRDDSVPEDSGQRLSNGARLILILSIVGLLAALGLIGVVIYRKTGPGSQSRIVGVWIIKEWQLGFQGRDATVEFTQAGKVIISAAQFSASGTYRLRGDSIDLTWDLNQFDFMPRFDTWRIITLTEAELVFESPAMGGRARLRRAD